MSKTTTKRKAKKIEIETGSGNVFTDLNLPNADQLLGKAELAHKICTLIESADLTQAQAARRLRIDQPKISALMRGKLAGLSTDRLLRFINALDQDVIISIRPAQTRNHARLILSS